MDSQHRGGLVNYRDVIVAAVSLLIFSGRINYESRTDAATIAWRTPLLLGATVGTDIRWVCSERRRC